MKTNLKFILIALFTLAITACSSEDGKDGLDGIDGEQGIPGQDGNANVTSYIFKNIIFEVGVSDPIYVQAITQEILDNGVVLGYLHEESTPEWYPLPFVSGNGHISIYIVALGLVVIESTSQTNPLDLRIVVIKGSAGNGSKNSGDKNSSQAIYDELKAANVDINDYDAVLNYYNAKN